MKIVIGEENKKHTIRVPIRLCNCALVRKIIVKNSGLSDLEKDNLNKCLRLIVKELVRFKKKNGRFEIVNVSSEDTNVSIWI